MSIVLAVGAASDLPAGPAESRAGRWNNGMSKSMLTTARRPPLGSSRTGQSVTITLPSVMARTEWATKGGTTATSPGVATMRSAPIVTSSSPSSTVHTSSLEWQCSWILEPASKSKCAKVILEVLNVRSLQPGSRSPAFSVLVSIIAIGFSASSKQRLRQVTARWPAPACSPDLRHAMSRGRQCRRGLATGLVERLLLLLLLSRQSYRPPELQPLPESPEPDPPMRPCAEWAGRLALPVPQAALLPESIWAEEQCRS